MVKVTISRDPHDGEAMTVDEHVDGNSVFVESNHLVVNDERGNGIAVYAPGQWLSAIVER